MRTILATSGFVAGAAMLVGIAGTTAIARADKKPAETPQMRFEKLVAGLTPGKPMTCLNDRSPSNLTAAGNKLIYRVSRNLVYVNETTGGCEHVAQGDTLVTKSFGGSLCRGDIARTVNLPARFPTGSCALGDFVPYRK